MDTDALAPDFAPDSTRVLGAYRLARRGGRTLMATRWGVRDLSRLNLTQLVVLLEGLPRELVSVDDIAWILEGNPGLSLGAPTGRVVAGRPPEDLRPQDTPLGPEVYLHDGTVLYRLEVRPERVKTRAVARYRDTLAA